MKIIRAACISLVLLLVLSLPLWAEDPLVYVYTEYVPANYRDEAGRHTGFFVEIIREAIEVRLGIPLVMEVYPWQRCQVMVERGTADLMTTIPTRERLAYSVLVDSPSWVKKYHLYTWKGHHRIADMDHIHSIEELEAAGLSVVSYQGNNWSVSTLAAAGIPVHFAASVEGMYRMLVARRGDLIIDDPVLVCRALELYDLKERVIRTEGLVEESAFHPLIGKKSPWSFLKEDLERVLKEMWEDGSIEAITKRHACSAGNYQH